MTIPDANNIPPDTDGYDEEGGAGYSVSSEGSPLITTAMIAVVATVLVACSGLCCAGLLINYLLGK